MCSLDIFSTGGIFCSSFPHETRLGSIPIFKCSQNAIFVLYMHNVHSIEYSKARSTDLFHVMHSITC